MRAIPCTYNKKNNHAACVVHSRLVLSFTLSRLSKVLIFVGTVLDFRVVFFVRRSVFATGTIPLVGWYIVIALRADVVTVLSVA